MVSAEQDIARAQNALGIMYADGRGVPQDAAEAVRWFRLAAEQGNANAQANLGLRYGSRRAAGHVSDMWLNLAAATGHEDARKAREIVAAGMTEAQAVG